ncbi:universal stress protein [Seonamhaeicola sediminis]|uniref:Universal stress protein n=1 Tax=Seonamhaeicola sediminis TaxID=2528206 RepID=A0A562YE16_9FLAO|nr:universal stress protein [Seonamhaeicola sediminis]TWO32897.1 universal stress protein [Seonamhaeicola sediminis]
MKRKILLPTDFSKNAWHAINYALELYKNDYCNFYILNVFSFTNNIIDSLILMEPGSEMYETAKLESENKLAKVLNMLTLNKQHNPKHHFEVISTFNSTVEAIKNIVEERDIDIIVMGTKGKTGSKTVIYGSTAFNVMENVRNCPVIIVPELAKHNVPKEIVFPTSYNTHLKRNELSHLIHLAKNCKASILILHVLEEAQLDKKQINNKKLLAECFEDVDHSFHTISFTAIPVAINCFVESRASDMIAFINKKHFFFKSLLMQPLAKELSYHSKVPILVMHDLRN